MLKEDYLKGLFNIFYKSDIEGFIPGIEDYKNLWLKIVEFDPQLPEWVDLNYNKWDRSYLNQDPNIDIIEGDNIVSYVSRMHVIDYYELVVKREFEREDVKNPLMILYYFLISVRDYLTFDKINKDLNGFFIKWISFLDPLGYYDKNLYPEVIDNIKLIHGDNLIYIDNESGSIYINYQRAQGLNPDFKFNYVDKVWELEFDWGWTPHSINFLNRISWIFIDRFRDFKLGKILS
jgi:hypothetical protein